MRGKLRKRWRRARAPEPTVAMNQSWSSWLAAGQACLSAPGFCLGVVPSGSFVILLLVQHLGDSEISQSDLGEWGGDTVSMEEGEGGPSQQLVLLNSELQATLEEGWIVPIDLWSATPDSKIF